MPPMPAPSWRRRCSPRASGGPPAAPTAAPSSSTPGAARALEGETVRLRGADIGRVNRLYSAEGGPASYTSRHIEEGVYYGVIQEGRLGSIAGTHGDSPAERMAVVGNVFTHPLYRGGGLATIATRAGTAALLAPSDLVALTVEAAT